MRDPFLDYVADNDIDMVKSYLGHYYHLGHLKNARGENALALSARLGLAEMYQLLVESIHFEN